MKIIFIRHGEPNYRELEERSYTGFGIDLAPLSEKGRQQVQELCKDKDQTSKHQTKKKKKKKKKKKPIKKKN